MAMSNDDGWKFPPSVKRNLFRTYTRVPRFERSAQIYRWEKMYKVLPGCIQSVLKDGQILASVDDPYRIFDDITRRQSMSEN